jgi:uncharacterized protein
MVRRIMGAIKQACQLTIIGLIKGYQYIISPWFGSCCRFYPSCSHYAIEAIREYGIIYGSFLMVKRLCKCHPWHCGGIDYVPPRQRKGKV